MDEKTIWLYVSTGIVGSQRKTDLGYTETEWAEMPEEARELAIDGALPNICDIWTKAE